MSEVCPVCGVGLSPGIAPDYCPVCTLRGALAPELLPNGPMTRIGDYELIEELARGGAGVVFRARQLSLNRNVAVKLLLGGQFTHPAARQRFRTEATATARLRHPNIVTIFDVGEEEGQGWLAMELMEGGTLADRVHQGPLPAPEAARIVTKLAIATQAAHDAGILHRDLKPANVLLDSLGEPHISDFGLAKLQNTDSEVTRSGQVFGSPSYMAPEQAAGRNTEIDPRTDVYALGAILYHLLTARPPFQSDSTTATLRLVETAEPIPPRQLNPRVPVDLETITLKCLEKARAQRYPSALALAQDLERFTAGRPVAARPLGPVARAWRWSQRRKALAFSWFLLVILAIGSTAAAMWIRRAEQEAVHRLIDSLVAQSTAIRHSDRSDRRRESLRLVREALALFPDKGRREQLRTEAIAALALPDAGVVLPTSFPPSADAMMLCVDPDFQIGTVQDAEDRLRVIRLKDGRELKRLSINSQTCDQVQEFNRGGSYLALRAGERSILWDLERDAAVLGTNGATGTGAFDPEGKRFARGEPGGIGLYRLADMRHQFLAVPDLSAPISILAWLDGDRVVAALTNSQVALCDLTRGNVTWQRLGGAASVMAISRDKRWIGLGLSNGRLIVLAAETGDVAGEFGGFGEHIVGLGFDPAGGILAVADLGGSVRLLGLPDGEVLLEQPLLTWHLRFDRAGARLGPVRQGNRLGWIEWNSSRVAFSLRPARAGAEPRFAQFSSDGNWLARAAGNEVLVWDIRSGELAVVLPTDRVRSLRFGATDGELWVADFTGFTRWQLGEQDGALKATRRSHPRETELFDEFEFTRDGRTLAGTALDGTRIRVGAIADSSALREFGRAAGVWHEMLALSPGGEFVLTGQYAQPTIRVLSAGDGKVVFEQSDTGTICGAFSPDGKWVVTSGQTTQLWRVAGWRLSANLGGAPAIWPDQVPAFAPTSDILAYRIAERVIRLVTLPEGKRLVDLESPGKSSVHALAFSPHGNWLAATRDRGLTTLWNLTTLRQELTKLGLSDHP